IDAPLAPPGPADRHQTVAPVISVTVTKRPPRRHRRPYRASRAPSHRYQTDTGRSVTVIKRPPRPARPPIPNGTTVRLPPISFLAPSSSPSPNGCPAPGPRQQRPGPANRSRIAVLAKPGGRNET